MDYLNFFIDKLISRQLLIVYEREKRLNPLIGLILLCGRLWNVAIAEMADDGLHTNRWGTVRTSFVTLTEFPFLNRLVVCFEENRT